VDPAETLAPLPRPAPLHEVLADYEAAGLSLRSHPMTFLRPLLDKLEAVPAGGLTTTAPGRALKVAGVVLLRQRPATANGVTFVTLEDETGMANLIIRKEVWERCRRAARNAAVLLADGTLQREGDVTHVLVAGLEDLSARLAALYAPARDFR
jgi:error-prone DNA polymerase